MKYSAVIAAAMAAVASAQNISIFPACSLPCIESAVTNSTNCQLTDYACICSNMATLTTAATPCVVEKCGVDVATSMFPLPEGSPTPECNRLTPHPRPGPPGHQGVLRQRQQQQQQLCRRKHIYDHGLIQLHGLLLLSHGLYHLLDHQHCRGRHHVHGQQQHRQRNQDRLAYPGCHCRCC